MFLGLAGCALSPVNRPLNVQASAAVSEKVREPEDVFGETVIALSFSGGGTRAAAFAFGVLQGLDGLSHPSGTRLLEDVGFISSVSGGSLTAAYFGLHGAQSLQNFRSVLLKDGEASMRFSLLNPVNLLRLWSGGLNDRSNLRAWLDEDVFHGATYKDMFRRGKPVVWVNATNVYHRVSFPFSQLAFDVLCSDLASYPVAEAVAASMAVPLVFSPIVLQNHSRGCRQPKPTVDTAKRHGSLMTDALAHAVQHFSNPESGGYLKLIDGGVTDNFGLATIRQARLLRGKPFSPLSERDAIRVGHLLYVVVDAGQGPGGDWDQRLDGPSGMELANAAIDAAMSANMRMSYDGFAAQLQQWRQDIVQYRCALSAERQLAITREQPRWRCDDVEFSVTRLAFDGLPAEAAAKLSALPTRLTLPEADIDLLIQAGHELVTLNPQVRAFQRGLPAPAP